MLLVIIFVIGVFIDLPKFVCTCCTVAFRNLLTELLLTPTVCLCSLPVPSAMKETDINLKGRVWYSLFY